MVQAGRGRGPDVHTGPLAHGLQPLQNLDLAGVIFLQDVYKRQIEENPGYEKTVVEDGPVRFTLFQSAAGYDRMHPMVVLYAEYTGDVDLDTCLLYTSRCV